MLSRQAMWHTRPKTDFNRFIGYDHKQLVVNAGADFESYAGTCFHSQQLAEKVLKQKLQVMGVENVYTHSLLSLADDLAFLYGYDINGKGTHDLREALISLSDQYIATRYPLEGRSYPKITKKMAEDSVDQCRLILAWVGSMNVPANMEHLDQRREELDVKRKIRSYRP